MKLGRNRLGWRSGGGGGIESIVAGNNITVDNTDPENPIVSTNADDITVVANYSALPSPAAVSGKFYWCSASEGTKFIGILWGGTYYPAGQYYSNGVSWEYMDTPSQATQAEVDAGTVTNKWVSPETFQNASRWSTVQAQVELISATFDGQGGVVAAGSQVTFMIPFTGTIIGWTLLETSGTPVASTCVMDAWIDTYANYPPTVADTIFGTKPSLTGAIKNQATGLSIAVTGGSIGKLNLDSNTGGLKLKMIFNLLRS